MTCCMEHRELTLLDFVYYDFFLELELSISLLEHWYKQNGARGIYFKSDFYFTFPLLFSPKSAVEDTGVQFIVFSGQGWATGAVFYWNKHCIHDLDMTSHNPCLATNSPCLLSKLLFQLSYLEIKVHSTKLAGYSVLQRFKNGIVLEKLMTNSITAHNQYSPKFTI